MNYRMACLTLIIVMCVRVFGQAEERTVRLLTVGNSFADNALTYLPEIVKASGNKLVYAKANLGGCTMKRHWDHVEKYEADHSDKAGAPYGGGKYSLAQMLAKDAWDVVTIQQVSWKSHDPSTFHPYAENLYGYIHKHAPQATILLHQTWAYRVDDPRFKPANEGKEPHTHAIMYKQVRKAYHDIADELGIGILPSGDAMYLADTDATWGYKPDTSFDGAKAAYPQLPDQTHSLHGGYHWKKQKDGGYKLSMDGHHAGNAGKYLIGCVWFEILYGQNVTDNPFVPAGLNPDYARFLRQTAHRAVAELQASAAREKPKGAAAALSGRMLLCLDREHRSDCPEALPPCER